MWVAKKNAPNKDMLGTLNHEPLINFGRASELEVKII